MLGVERCDSFESLWKGGQYYVNKPGLDRVSHGYGVL